MANEKTRNKRRAVRQKKLLQKQDQQIVIENDDEDLDLPIEEVNEPEPEPVMQKSYDEPYGYDVPSPTSWQEVDELRKAQEQAEQVREMSWTVRDLVSNIVRSNMTPDEKAKAISEVGTGFSTRIKNSGKHEKMEKAIDMDLLEIRALIAKDKRHTPISEKLTDWIGKAISTEEKLSDEDFALVIDNGDEGKIRNYPVHDRAHVRKTLSEVAQLLEKGGDIAEEVRAILPNIHTAVKKLGIGRFEGESNSVIIEKDTTGKWRAVMYPTNNFKDTDGEILSEAAHIEYVDWVSKNMDLAPVFVSWHIPETIRKNRVDFVDYTSGYLLMSAPLEEHEAAGLLRVQEQCDIGMSHGTFALERDAANPKIITKYRMVEVSDLPLAKAANPFTDFSVVSKENPMNDNEKMKYLTGLLGEEKAKEYFAKAGLKQKALREVGVEEKEAKSEPETATPEAPATAPAVPGADLEVIFKELEKRLDIPGLQQFVTEAKTSMEKIDILETVIKAKSESADEAIAQKIAPPIRPPMERTRGPLTRLRSMNSPRLIR